MTISRRTHLLTAMAAMTAAACYAVAGLQPLEFVDDGDGAGGETGAIDGAPADAGADRFLGCSSGLYTFCDDFEAPLSVGPDGGRWTALESLGASRLERDQGTLLVELTPGDSGSTSYARLFIERGWPLAAGLHPGITFEFRIQVESCPKGGFRDLVTLVAMRKAVWRYYAIISLGEQDGECQTGLGMVDVPPDGGAGGYLGHLQQTLAVGAWKDVKILISEVSLGMVLVVLEIDGAERRLTLTTGTEYDTFALGLGIAGTLANDGRARFDDVRAIYTP